MPGMDEKKPNRLAAPRATAKGGRPTPPAFVIGLVLLAISVVSVLVGGGWSNMEAWPMFFAGLLLTCAGLTQRSIESTRP